MASLVQLRAKKAGLSRDRAPDDPEFVAVGRELAEASITAHVQRVLASAPPLTAEQRNRLAIVLQGGAGG